MSLQWQRDRSLEEEVESVEWSNTTKFVLCKNLNRPHSMHHRRGTHGWFILCERTILEAGIKEEIVISSTDTESNARKAFRLIRRITGYVDCDNEIAIPGLF